jgi:hypothetical protein
MSSKRSLGDTTDEALGNSCLSSSSERACRRGSLEKYNSSSVWTACLLVRAAALLITILLTELRQQELTLGLDIKLTNSFSLCVSTMKVSNKCSSLLQPQKFHSLLNQLFIIFLVLLPHAKSISFNFSTFQTNMNNITF